MNQILQPSKSVRLTDLKTSEEEKNTKTFLEKNPEKNETN